MEINFKKYYSIPIIILIIGLIFGVGYAAGNEGILSKPKLSGLSANANGISRENRSLTLQVGETVTLDTMLGRCIAFTPYGSSTGYGDILRSAGASNSFVVKTKTTRRQPCLYSQGSMYYLKVLGKNPGTTAISLNSGSEECENIFSVTRCYNDAIIISYQITVVTGNNISIDEEQNVEADEEENQDNNTNTTNTTITPPTYQDDEAFTTPRNINGTNEEQSGETREPCNLWNRIWGDC